MSPKGESPLVMFFMETFELVVTRFGIALLVVRIAEEEIAQWKT